MLIRPITAKDDSIMKPRALIVTFCLLAILAQIPLLHARPLAGGDDADFERLKAEAEARYAEGSYAQANEIYQQLAAKSLSDAQKRWVNFRLHDTIWRSQASTNHPDSTLIDLATLERGNHPPLVIVVGVNLG